MELINRTLALENTGKAGHARNCHSLQWAGLRAKASLSPFVHCFFSTSMCYAVIVVYVRAIRGACQSRLILRFKYIQNVCVHTTWMHMRTFVFPVYASFFAVETYLSAQVQLQSVYSST